MFNKSLYDIATLCPPDINMHDQWFVLKASLTGHILYSHKSYVYYRQYGNNVVGAKERSFFERFMRLFVTTRKIRNAAWLTSKTAVRVFGEQEKITKKLIFIYNNVFLYFHLAKKYTVFLFIFSFLIKETKFN